MPRKKSTAPTVPYVPPRVLLSIVMDPRPLIEIAEANKLDVAVISAIKQRHNSVPTRGPRQKRQYRRLDEQIIHLIRSDNRTLREIATDWQIDRSTVSSIQLGRTYADIPWKQVPPITGPKRITLPS